MEHWKGMGVEAEGWFLWTLEMERARMKILKGKCWYMESRVAEVQSQKYLMRSDQVLGGNGGQRKEEKNRGAGGRECWIVTEFKKGNNMGNLTPLPKTTTISIEVIEYI